MTCLPAGQHRHRSSINREGTPPSSSSASTTSGYSSANTRLVSSRPRSPKGFCSPSPSAWRRKSRCRCDQHACRPCHQDSRRR
jgi:hypothetical protein